VLTHGRKTTNLNNPEIELINVILPFVQSFSRLLIAPPSFPPVVPAAIQIKALEA